jgi:hypothetical protein
VTGRDSLLDVGEFDARTIGLLLIAGRELTRARAKFEPFNSPHEGWAVIYEEAVKELGDHVWANTGSTPEAFWEAIQTAAMALRYAYDLSDVSAWEVADVDAILVPPPVVEA